MSNSQKEQRTNLAKRLTKESCSTKVQTDLWEDLVYHKIINTFSHNAFIPVQLRESIMATASENPSTRQGAIKGLCDEWLDKFKVDCNVEQIEAVYQLKLFLSKVPFRGDKDSCRQAAIETFLDGERRCRETNKRLEVLFSNPQKWLDLSSLLESERDLVLRVRAEFFRIFGDFDVDKFERIIKSASRFGPGQTADDVRGYEDADKDTRDERKVRCSTIHKMSRSLYLTSASRPYLKPLLRANHSFTKTLYLSSLPKDNPNFWDYTIATAKVLYEGDDVIRFIDDTMVHEQNYDRISFVAKNATTDRTIGLQTGVTGMLQLSAGKEMKTSLLNSGINLYDQSINQMLALQGSLHNHVATMDLKNASQTIAKNAVKLVVPIEWYMFLVSLRAESGLLHQPKFGYDGELIRYESFSSMGNGYTFELESGIFCAIVRAVVGLGSKKHHLISIYGDDIICPSEDAEAVRRALEWFGFQINEDKTFVDGPFRESCGVDSYKGKNIRPMVISRRIRSYRDIWFLLNKISYTCLDRRSLLLQDVYHTLWGLLPTELILPGPLTFAFKPHETREGSFELDVDDLESGVKMPLSKALDYKTHVEMCKRGVIRYVRMKVRQLMDSDGKYGFITEKESDIRILGGYFSPCFSLTQPTFIRYDKKDRPKLQVRTHDSSLKVMAGISGLLLGQVPVRDKIALELKTVETVVWETYTSEDLRRYFPG